MAELGITAEQILGVSGAVSERMQEQEQWRIEGGVVRRQTDRWVGAESSASELRLSPLFAYPGPLLWGPLMHDLLRSANCLCHVR